jgi:hypothetical protein
MRRISFLVASSIAATAALLSVPATGAPVGGAFISSESNITQVADLYAEPRRRVARPYYEPDYVAPRRYGYYEEYEYIPYPPRPRVYSYLGPYYHPYYYYRPYYLPGYGRPYPYGVW